MAAAQQLPVTPRSAPPLDPSMRESPRVRRTGRVVVLLFPLLLPTPAWACDEADHARAALAERAHRLGDAIARRTALLECAPDARSIGNVLALARDHAALGEFARAAELIERGAAQAPGDARVVEAMDLAVGYRVALRDLPLAQSDARWLLTATGPTGATSERAFEVGAALESASQWTEASLWYDALARGFPARERWALQARALVGLGRAYEALGDLGSAVRSWEAANARWPIARAALGIVDPCADERRRAAAIARANRRRGRYGRVTEAGTDLCAANGHLRDDSDGDGPPRFFAEAQFRLARHAANPCSRPDDFGPVPTTRLEFDRWVESHVLPAFRRRQACVEEATGRMGDVVNLHVPQWEIAAVAVVSHLYATFGWAIASTPLPPDVPRASGNVPLFNYQWGTRIQPPPPELYDAYRAVR